VKPTHEENVRHFLAVATISEAPPTPAGELATRLSDEADRLEAKARTLRAAAAALVG
jgi:hypothetical protein